MRRLRLAALATVLLLAGCASIPYEHASQHDQPPPAVQPPDGSPERVALNARVYDAVVDHVGRLFYRGDFDRAGFAADAAARRDGAMAQADESGLHARIEELLDTLDDDHTYALSPTERERAAARRQGQSRASYGLVLTEIGEAFVVSLVRADSPAARAGVLPGWQLASIEGQPVAVSPPPAEGHVARLEFVDDDGGTRSIELVAQAMSPLPRRESRRLDDDIAYLRFDDFDRATHDWLAREMERLSTAPPRGLILDLRRNGGGLTHFAALAHAHFHPQRQDFMVLEGRRLDRRIYAAAPAHAYAGPLVVLVGPATASSAELLAARLQETGRASVIGARSRGAVVGTRGINLPDGGLLYVGMWMMATAGGQRLEKVGVTPDLTLAADWPAVREGRDPALDAALEALRTGE
ncbi:S41 family peptidase [Luteimonas saliphila]|uniref:S41 family peptidase n=1 Tax=Luteimonas saliphila TaxID=2804919 RepID=UPI00192D9512|nr:S41 family peptidase [Luteimonas saliphila]